MRTGGRVYGLLRGAWYSGRAGGPADPLQFQDGACSCSVGRGRRGGSATVTIGNDAGVLERMLGHWAARRGRRPRMTWTGWPAGSRRVGGIHSLAAGICSRSRGSAGPGGPQGCRDRGRVRGPADCPVDEFNSSRHVGDDSPAQSRRRPRNGWRSSSLSWGRIATARRYAPAARDYALFRTLYHAGLRSEEAARWIGRSSLRPGPVRQAARAVRQGRADFGAAAAVGADAGRPGRAAALVPRGRARPVPRSPVLFSDESGGGCTAARSATGCAT